MCWLVHRWTPLPSQVHFIAESVAVATTVVQFGGGEVGVPSTPVRVASSSNSHIRGSTPWDIEPSDLCCFLKILMKLYSLMHALMRGLKAQSIGKRSHMRSQPSRYHYDIIIRIDIYIDYDGHNGGINCG